MERDSLKEKTIGGAIAIHRNLGAGLSVEKLTGIHEAQLLADMRSAQVEPGLLINFSVRRLVDGVKRYGF